LMDSARRSVNEANQSGLEQLRIVIQHAARRVEWMSRIVTAPENENIPAELRAELRASVRASQRVLEYGSSAISNLSDDPAERAGVLLAASEVLMQIMTADVPDTPILDAIAAQLPGGCSPT
jgi:hypothetical protein